MGTCPTADGAFVRLANVSVGATPVDFCFTANGMTFGPMMKCAAPTSMLAYPKVSKQIAIPAGTYDVTAVTGGMDCSTTALGGVGKVNVAAGKTVTVSSTPSGVTALPDVKAMAGSGEIYFRFIHGVKGVGALDVGLADKLGAGASISLTVLGAVPPGGASTAMATPDGLLMIDTGYLRVTKSFYLGPTVVAAAPTAAMHMKDGVLTPTINLAAESAEKSFTAFGIGDATAMTGAAIVCEDAVADGDFTKCIAP